jgi:gliding motility-associated-like protein
MNNIIPNVITPNGDGVNEKWEIPLLKYYPDAEVRIFDINGKLIRSFDPGYPDPWDGTDEMGNPVPMGTYFHIINLKDSETKKPLTGPVTVLR